MSFKQWILTVCLLSMIEKNVAQLQPGQCDIQYGYVLTCNDVTQEQINDLLSQNQITSINIYNGNMGTFDSNYFLNGTAEKLDYLSINNNQIVTIADDTFTDYTTFFTTFSMSNNPLTNLPAILFHNLKYLLTLTIQKCQLTHLERETFSQMESITYIYLDGNPIETIENGTFLNLHDVDVGLSNAKLQKFPTFAFENSRIYTLTVANNFIEQLEDGAFDTISDVATLDLSHNRLESLPDGLFSRMHQLGFLYLSSNQLIEFSVKNVSLSRPLVTLDLSGNALSYIDLNEFKDATPILGELYLANNPWNCDTLPEMIEDSFALVTEIQWGPLNYTVPNVNGIPCVQEPLDM